MKRHWLNVLFVLVLISYSSKLFAAGISKEVEQALQAVAKNFHSIKTIQGKIKRNITMGSTREISEGFFAQQVPDKKEQQTLKVFLEYTTIPSQQVISDGDDLWIYSKANNEVVHLENLTAQETVLMQRFDFHYLLDTMAASTAYTLEMHSKNGDEIVLAAIPKNANPYVSKVLIKIDLARGAIFAYETFSNNDLLTNQVKFEDYQVFTDNIFYPKKIITTSIIGPNRVMTQTTELFRLKFNQPIAATRFSFTPPQGAKIIERAELQKKLNLQ